MRSGDKIWRSTKAFTLIEVLLVIATIGILASLIAISVMGSVQKGRDAKAKSNARAVDVALAAYEVENRSFPIQNTSGGVTIETIQSNLSPSYLAGTAAFTHTKAAKYISTQSGDNYAQSWELESSAEGVVSNGNGVYATNASGAAGGVTAVGTTGGALQFDGVNDNVTLPSGFSDFTAGLTISFWFYPTSTAVWQRVVDLANGTANNNILVMRRLGTQDMAFEVYSGATSQGVVYAAGSITQNTWQHFVITLDASRNVSIYKNGIAQALNGGVSTSVAIAGMPPNITRISNLIGKSNWPSDPYFQGSIDDLRIYSTNLSTAAIAALYNSGYGSYGVATESNLLAGWRFDEGTGLSATDYKGTMTGTLSNGPIWVPGKAPLGLTGIGSLLTGKAFVTSRTR